MRELGGEIWAELTYRFEDDRLHWEVRQEVADMVMGVLARYDGVVIRNDVDFPVEPLPPHERSTRE